MKKSDSKNDITNRELLTAFEDVIDQKLEEKLEQKLDEKLEQKLDEKLGGFMILIDEKIDIRFNEFAVLMMNGFERLESKMNLRFDDLESRHDQRITTCEDRLVIIKKSIESNLGASISW